MEEGAMTQDATTRQASKTSREASGASIYELFMGILTIISLGVIAWQLLASNEQIEAILGFTDTVFCVIFLLDFSRSLRRAPSKVAYLLGPRPGRSLPEGVLDLLGSVPAIGVFRIFRVFRLTRIRRLLVGQTPAQLVHDFIAGRASSALYVVVVVAILVLLFGSTFVIYAESPDPDANIVTGYDAIWWAFVTITTVGYGDRYPVTEIGRMIGMVTMAVGIGVFGVFTSYLATAFMASPEDAEPEASPAPVGEATPGSGQPDAVARLSSQMTSLQAEIAELRRALEARQGG
jgi:voltage-gated potassium channel Kch